MPFALIPEGFELVKVTKAQEQAVRSGRDLRHGHSPDRARDLDPRRDRQGEALTPKWSAFSPPRAAAGC